MDEPEFLSVENIPRCWQFDQVDRILKGLPPRYGKDERHPPPGILDKLSLLKYDITKLKVDAIVTFADENLRGGGGAVDAAIHRAGGRNLRAECEKIVAKLGSTQPGQVRVTSGHDVGWVFFIIHAIKPVNEDGTEKELLKSCYLNSLKKAAERGFEYIAFSSDSGFSTEYTAGIALKTAKEFLESAPDAYKVKRVIFCTSNMDETDTYVKLLPTYFPWKGWDGKKEDASSSN